MLSPAEKPGRPLVKSGTLTGAPPGLRQIFFGDGGSCISGSTCSGLGRRIFPNFFQGAVNMGERVSP
jgi:hypothetical protein